MKIIVLGDTHGRAFWKQILFTQDWDRAIFIGDYFDTHQAISPELQMINFREIAQFAEKEKDRVVLLIGNHDEHYFPFMGYSGTSGYQGGAAPAIGHLLMTYIDLMKMAHSEGNVLFSHAGVGESWLEANDNHIIEDKPLTASGISDVVNDLWKYKPQLFKFTGVDSTGDDIGQTPIWIRPRSLMRDSQDFKKLGIIQVVGHTIQRKIDIDGKSTGGKYFFIDTLGTSGEYLIIEDGVFKTGKI